MTLQHGVRFDNIVISTGRSTGKTSSLPVLAMIVAEHRAEKAWRRRKRGLLDQSRTDDIVRLLAAAREEQPLVDWIHEGF